MYPVSGRILILQRSSGFWGNSATAYFALRAAVVRESSFNDVLEPSAWLPGVSWKIGRALSTRGITLCRWKFAMTAAAVNPFLSYCAWGDTPQSHFAGRSQSTRLVNAGSAPRKFRR